MPADAWPRRSTDGPQRGAAPYRGVWTSLLAALMSVMASTAEAARYTPSAHHPVRPPGAIYDDEVGENIVGTSYRRVVEVFGPPFLRRRPCVYYRQVGDPGRYWRFCFDDQRRMNSAMANVRAPEAP